jgi:transposase
MEKVSTIGIDLAKNSFQVFMADKRGKKIKNLKIHRDSLFKELEKLSRTEDLLIGMESCGGSHHVARELISRGFDVKIMAAKFIKPYVKSNKNDANDAEAIAEALRRPNMRFVGLKTLEQQTIQSIHRVREGFVKRKTAIVNEIRGLLLEFGIIIPQGINSFKKRIKNILSDENESLFFGMRELLQDLYGDFLRVVDKVAEYDQKLQKIAFENESCKKISEIPGVGPITATAIVSSIGNIKDFKNGREFSAFLGLVPRQYSTGGKNTLLGISKRGDHHIRKTLIHGCRSVVRWSEEKTDKTSLWIKNKVETRGKNKATVALANKTARVIWVLLNTEASYKPA